MTKMILTDSEDDFGESTFTTIPELSSLALLGLGGLLLDRRRRGDPFDGVSVKFRETFFKETMTDAMCICRPVIFICYARIRH